MFWVWSFGMLGLEACKRWESCRRCTFPVIYLTDSWMAGQAPDQGSQGSIGKLCTSHRFIGCHYHDESPKSPSEILGSSPLWSTVFGLLGVASRQKVRRARTYRALETL